MAKRTCSVDGCERPSKWRGWCQKHYYRWYRHSDPLAVRPGLPRIEQSFWKKVVILGGCWGWSGAKNHGHGIFHARGRQVQAHRFAYELLVGPIPEGMTVGHRCHDEAAEVGACAGGECVHRECCNPAHLCLQTRGENTLSSPLTPSGKAARATHCPAGHAYDERNTRFNKDGTRHCRTCDAARHRERRRAS